jgi:hypothetical protein
MTTTRDKIEYSGTVLFLGNFVIIVWILIGTIVCWLFNPFGALGFLALSGFLVYYELGKKGCLSCFLRKTCTIGFGKLFDVFFTKRGYENLNRKGRKLFPFVYLLLTFVPIAIVTISINESLSTFKGALLLTLITFSTASGIASLTRKIKFN